MITPTLPPPSPTVPPNSGIQEIKQMIQEKVREKLQEISQGETDPKKAIIAAITKIEGGSLFFNTQSLIKEATVDENTVYIGLKQNKIKFSDLKVSQEVLVIGLLDQDGKLLVKRLILTPQKSFQNLKVIIFGQVVDISTSSPVLVVIPYSDKNSQYQIKYTNNTTVLTKTGKKITTESIKKGQKIAVVATPDSLSRQSLISEKIVTLE
ncbi:MAG: hypothetical protein AAB574_02670 [Patescibacteria group bacterium]